MVRFIIKVRMVVLRFLGVRFFLFGKVFQFFFILYDIDIFGLFFFWQVGRSAFELGFDYFYFCRSLVLFFGIQSDITVCNQGCFVLELGVLWVCNQVQYIFGSRCGFGGGVQLVLSGFFLCIYVDVFRCERGFRILQSRFFDYRVDYYVVFIGCYELYFFVFVFVRFGG